MRKEEGRKRRERERELSPSPYKLYFLLFQQISQRVLFIKTKQTFPSSLLFPKDFVRRRRRMGLEEDKGGGGSEMKMRRKKKYLRNPPCPFNMHTAQGRGREKKRFRGKLISVVDGHPSSAEPVLDLEKRKLCHFLLWDSLKRIIKEDAGDDLENVFFNFPSFIYFFYFFFQSYTRGRAWAKALNLTARGRNGKRKKIRTFRLQFRVSCFL